MIRKLRGLAIVVAMCGGMLAAPAWAQETVSFKGVEFQKPDGWCLKRARQGDSIAIELRRCGADYPYLSATVLNSGSGAADWNIAEMAVNFAKLMEGAEGGPTFASAIEGAYGACEKSAMSVDRNPIPGVAGATVVATMACTKDGKTQSIDFRNFTSYVQTRSGVLWCVTFDYPNTSLTDDDKAVIKGAADSITAAP